MVFNRPFAQTICIERSKVKIPFFNRAVSSRQVSRKHLGLLLGLVGVTVFGATLPVTRIAVVLFDPWFITFGRALLGGFVALLVLASLGLKFPRTHKWPIMAACALVVFGFPGFMALAMVTVPAVRGGLVLGILPLMTAFFATLIGNERPSLPFWFWSVLGAGLVTLFVLGNDAGAGQGAQPGLMPGDLWLLLAAICASLGYVILAGISRFMPGWQAISWAIAAGLPVSLAGSAIFWRPQYLQASGQQVLAFAYLGIFSAYVGFFAWNAGLKLGGMARVGQVQLLQTFITFAFAMLLLGESVDIRTLVFALLVFVVVLMGQRARVDKVFPAPSDSNRH